MDEEELKGIDDISGLSADLNTIQQMMIENTLIIKKRMASTLNPLLCLAIVISVIILGLLLNIGSTLINIVVAMILVILIVGLLFLRHFFYIRSTDNVVEYLSTGEPLKDRVSVPYLDKVLPFLSPKEVYESAQQLVDEEWIEIFPILETELEKIYESRNTND